MPQTAMPDDQDMVVTLDYCVAKAFEGKYFAGHTPVLALRGLRAWAALANPQGSGVNLFLNTYSVSNYSDAPVQSQAWMNCPLGHYRVSAFVSTSNLAQRPLSVPKAELAYQYDVPSEPREGISLFPMIAAANQTTIGTYSGRYIVPPGGSFAVFLCARDNEAAAEVAFGWWEERAR
jgi:hypothetical protein